MDFEWMENRIEILEAMYKTVDAKLAESERKLEKLKQLLLLTDPVVENEVMNDIAMKQWMEFIKCFPDEAR